MNVTTVQPVGNARWAAGRAARRALGCVAQMVMVAVLGAFVVTNRMGYQTLIVRSGSMTGTADVGSLVVARPITAEDVRVGDIILIRRERDGQHLAPVLHRVVKRQVDASGQIVIQTKGDANTAPDPEMVALRGATVTPVLIVPHLGVAVAALRTPVGWFGLVIFPMVAAMSIALRRLWADETTHRDEDR